MPPDEADQDRLRLIRIKRKRAAQSAPEAPQSPISEGGGGEVQAPPAIAPPEASQDPSKPSVSEFPGLNYVSADTPSPEYLSLAREAGYDTRGGREMEAVRARFPNTRPDPETLARYQKIARRDVEKGRQAARAETRPVPGFYEEMSLRGLDVVAGPPENDPRPAKERAVEGGLGRDLTLRAPDTRWAEIPAAFFGGMAEMAIRPEMWLGAPAGGTAARAAGAATGAAGRAVRPAVAKFTDETAVGAWMARGKKGLLGKDMTEAVWDWQAARHATTIQSESEGAKVARAFNDLKNKPDLEKALYEYDHYGTPVPDHLKEGATEALAVYRRTRSELSELSQTLKTISDETKREYPVWVPRFFEEPIQEAAERGYKGRSRLPGIQTKHEREDAFNLMFHGLEPKEVEELVYGRAARKPMFGRPAEEALPAMPKEFQPLQPMAPTMSKGTIEKVGGGTFVKFPNTPEGRSGAGMLQDMIQGKIDEGGSYAKRGIKVTRTDPILKTDEALDLAIEAGEEGGKGPAVLTPITDAPTIISRGWRKVLTDEANDALFHKVSSAVDDSGEAISTFIPEKWVGPGQRIFKDVPDGYVLMENVDSKRNWGVLMNATQDLGDEKIIKGAYAVREDVARYISNMEEHSTAMGDFFHDLADTIATSQISGPPTAVMNQVTNKIGIDSINGTSLLTPVGRRIQSKARSLSKDHLRTGILPKELEPLAPYLSDPATELSGATREEILGFDDKVSAIFEAAETPTSRPGKLLGELLVGSPFAKSRVVTAAGGALGGAIEETVRGGDPLTGAAAGAGLALLSRWTAPKMLNWFRHSDRVTTIAAFLKHKEDAIAAGLPEQAAIGRALEKTVDLTQAGQWGRLGGISESIGSAPAGMVGTRTAERGARKLLLNRYIKWSEVQGNILYNAATKYGVKEQIGAAITVSALAGFKYGGRRAVVGTGLMTEEEAQRAEAKNPGAILWPAYDFAKKEAVPVALNGRAFSGTPLEITDITARGLSSKVLGSAGQSIVEGFQGDEARSTFSGVPLRMTELDTATPESGLEAQVRSNLRRYQSPYNLGGRLMAGIREGVEAYQRGEVKAPTPGEIVAGTLVGKVRTVDPARDLESLKGAFHAQANKVSDEYKSARNKTRTAFGLPVLDQARTQMSMREEAEKVADLAETYIDKGVPVEDLLKSKFKPDRDTMRRNAMVRQILIERGRLKAPAPGIPGLEK